jgi:4'-phosphopantetheinyl transferase
MNAITPTQSTDTQAHLWITKPGDIDDDSLLEQYQALLGDEELASYHDLLNADHKREYLISQAFLRDVLSYYSSSQPDQLCFERNASGKPGLKQAPADLQGLKFNLSHSAELIACAVTRVGDVGVDVEAFSAASNMVAVADHYFSAREVAALRQLPASEQERGFCKIWTLKEAYIKARGQGLALALDSFSFDCLQPDRIELSEHEQPNSAWRFWSLQPLPDHLVAVAVAGTDCSLRVFSGIPLQETRELSINALGLVA